ncbi:MAG: hypothetical protein ABIJ97_01500 [Bacteroidota bacterium]
MKTQDITLDFVAPIPTGHNVEVIQFRKKNSDKALIGLWIKDINTGIEYGMDFHYEDRNLVQFNHVSVWPIDIRDDLEIDKKIIGCVTRCRILTMRVNLNWQMQTRLQIEQES